MTLKVTIAHANPGYPKRAKVTPLDSAGVPMGSPDHIEAYAKIVADGESVDFYVHNGCTLKVEEIDAAPVITLDAGGGDEPPPK